MSQKDEWLTYLSDESGQEDASYPVLHWAPAVDVLLPWQSPASPQYTAATYLWEHTKCSLSVIMPIVS